MMTVENNPSRKITQLEEQYGEVPLKGTMTQKEPTDGTKEWITFVKHNLGLVKGPFGKVRAIIKILRFLIVKG
ncbi:MAG: hypothetical protein HRT90_04430 [Candidatus Margulisbacteria bacterium]|nr:hypothetical protein [Candidatus Margulisiibacteriota bacterium]